MLNRWAKLDFAVDHVHNPPPFNSHTVMSVLDAQIVLSLNANWQPIGWRSVRQAIVSLSGGDAEHPALALDITMDKEGNLETVSACTWEDWLKLPVREGDLAVATKNGAIRAPTAIISRNFNRMPVASPRLTKKAIYERDGGICQYTGERIGPREGNIDHVIPRDRGGKDTWDNLVWSKKEVNSRKGNKLNHEAGLVLRSKPKAPKPLPVSVSVGKPKRPEHAPFMIK